MRLVQRSARSGSELGCYEDWDCLTDLERSSSDGHICKIFILTIYRFQIFAKWHDHLTFIPRMKNLKCLLVGNAVVRKESGKETIRKIYALLMELRLTMRW